MVVVVGNLFDFRKDCNAYPMHGGFRLIYFVLRSRSVHVSIVILERRAKVSPWLPYCTIIEIHSYLSTNSYVTPSALSLLSFLFCQSFVFLFLSLFFCQRSDRGVADNSLFVRFSFSLFSSSSCLSFFSLFFLSCLFRQQSGPCVVSRVFLARA